MVSALQSMISSLTSTPKNNWNYIINITLMGLLTINPSPCFSGIGLPVLSCAAWLLYTTQSLLHLMKWNCCRETTPLFTVVLLSLRIGFNHIDFLALSLHKYLLYNASTIWFIWFNKTAIKTAATLCHGIWHIISCALQVSLKYFQTYQARFWATGNSRDLKSFDTCSRSEGFIANCRQCCKNSHRCQSTASIKSLTEVVNMVWCHPFAFIKHVSNVVDMYCILEPDSTTCHFLPTKSYIRIMFRLNGIDSKTTEWTTTWVAPQGIVLFNGKTLSRFYDGFNAIRQHISLQKYCYVYIHQVPDIDRYQYIF